MKLAAALLALAVSVFSTPAFAASTSPTRATLPFDADWRFLKADATSAEQPAFDDSAWRSLSVPHDWSIEGPILESNSTGQGGAFLPAGIGWYRKHFVLPQADAHRHVFVEFDGVMANSDVWINGTHLGKRPYGYVSFRYELTGQLTFGSQPNVIAVRCDNSQQPASRWDAGAGIYRHVHLIVTHDVHVDTWGTFVSTPAVTNAQATVHVQSTVTNQSSEPQQTSLQITLLNPNGKPVKTITTAPQTIAPNSTSDFTQDITVASPQRWDILHPTLYHAHVTVLTGTTASDEDTVAFGIREFHFDPDTGFWLNGKNFKLFGVCLHGDAGALGTAVPLGAWQHRLTELRKLGVNAIRTAHNPPSPEFLDLADRMGFLVMDEMFDCWTVAKNPYDYHLYFREWYRTDTRDTVRRDRNHPSIILWSAGNEIHDTPNAALAHEILASLVQVFHDNDPSRPVTQALFRPNVSHDYDNGLADLLDVVGQNYRENEIIAAHTQKPSRKIIGTENGHDRKAWLYLRDNKPYAGQFLWSGVDYLGEAHVWPYIGHDAGLLDRTDYPHPRGLERDSWWSPTPVVHIVRRLAPAVAGPVDPGEGTDPRRPRDTLFHDWTPSDLKPHEEDVEVYSNAETVELILNGKSLGSQPLHADASPRTWKVTFATGTLKAIASNGRSVVASDAIRTAGRPAALLLSASRNHIAAQWDDVSYITARVVDANGTTIPETIPGSDALITFATKGPGSVIAVDNADNTSHEPFQFTSGQPSERHAYRGRAIAIVRATAAGPFTITASAPGLKAATITLQAAPATQ